MAATEDAIWCHSRFKLAVVHIGWMERSGSGMKAWGDLTLVNKTPSNLEYEPSVMNVTIFVCLSVRVVNTHWEERPHAHRQNKQQGKEVIKINKNPIRLDVKCWALVIDVFLTPYVSV